MAAAAACSAVACNRRAARRGAACSRAARGGADDSSFSRRWFSNRRSTLAQELKVELKEEKQLGKDLKQTIDMENEEAEATLSELSLQLTQLREEEAKLRSRLREAEDEERASQKRLSTLKERLAEQGAPNWRAVIEQQTQMLRKILEVAERLEARETELRAELARRKAKNQALKADLTAAAELSEGPTAA